MRDIKFRTWNGNKMLYEVGSDAWGNPMIYEKNVDVGPLNIDMWIPYEGEVMQFTGLHDSTGRGIFEGDVVKHIIESEYLELEDWKTVTGAVKMIDGCWCVGEKQYPLFSFTNEVLGNIYENKTFSSLYHTDYSNSI